MNKEELEQKLNELLKVLLGLNAYGSLQLEDFKIIENQINASFDYEFQEL